jgi:hypothetical protein
MNPKEVLLGIRTDLERRPDAHANEAMVSIIEVSATESRAILTTEVEGKTKVIEVIARELFAAAPGECCT